MRYSKGRRFGSSVKKTLNTYRRLRHFIPVDPKRCQVTALQMNTLRIGRFALLFHLTPRIQRHRFADFIHRVREQIAPHILVQELAVGGLSG